MDLTKEIAERGKPDPAPAEDADEARVRARRYLDLWERQLVTMAVHGHLVAARRPPSR